MPTVQEFKQKLAARVPSEGGGSPLIGSSTAGGTAAGGLLPGCFGSVQARDGKTMTLNGETQFELASVSKTFTALLYAYALRSEKVVSATDPLSRWIPDLASAGLLGTLELKTLVNYTSGLPADNTENPGVHPANQKYPYSAADMIGFLTGNASKIDELITTQRQKSNVYAYSNLGFALLGLAVANALNGNFNNDLAGAMQSAIFASSGIGMPSSFLFAPTTADLPQGYDKNNKPAPDGNPLFPANWGGGGVVSTGNDMVRYLSFLMGILPDCQLNSVRKFLFAQTCASPRISAGWFIGTMSAPGKDDLTFYQKDGGLSGFSSWIGFVPGETGAGQFWLCNQNGIAPGLGLLCLKYWSGYGTLSDENPSAEEAAPSGEE